MHSGALPRRAVLRLGVLGLLTGCLPGKRRPRPPPVQKPDPDPAVTASVRAEEDRLVQSYNAALRAFPGLPAELTAIRDHHDEHRRSLPKAPGPSPSAAPSPAATTTESATPTQSIPTTDQAAAVAELLGLERAAARARVTDCLAASARLAPLLASIGASEAAHASVLAGVRSPR